MVLLTGATGQIGAALLPRLCARERVVALVRARDADHLAARAAELRALARSDTLDVVRGDTTAEGLGLSPADRDRVLAECRGILHSAAAVRFDLPEEDLVRQNVSATEHALALARELAEAGRLERLDHVSTAYVAGDRVDVVGEDEVDVGQGFKNGYEKSKCLAETRVRAAMAEGLPACVHRPSIVVGDSKTGVTRSFNVLYWPLKIYVRGWWRTFPGSPDTPVDVVPVDWLADAILAVRATPASLGHGVHHAVGPGAPTVRTLEGLVRSITGGPPLRYVGTDTYRRWVRPLLWPFFLTPRGRAIRRGGDVYFPYFRSNPRFAVVNRDAWVPTPPPPVESWLETVLRYAMERDFRAEGEGGR